MAFAYVWRDAVTEGQSAAVVIIPAARQTTVMQTAAASFFILLFPIFQIILLDIFRNPLGAVPVQGT